MTAQTKRLIKNVIIGANMKIKVFALLGKMVSFTNNFKPSAKACNIPKRPTTFGPLRWCILAITFLSNNVKYATPISNGTIRARDFKTMFKTLYDEK